ncbi:MAG: hypothetical protein AVDCRST_MAG40-2078 [uncultured Gemmatimonadaceae bacterium]|uniref:DUF155 domain-containing protein n=1 Tax=uncultured Gemmatimonadaceae bacterium TaxID=246130 RepID=A0A6J4LJ49_9BACT|nr:MAG: hypothetical protein AVDCRST_MAG40-2078 [uncultured Gemmatimonadaceae bacterium]
MTTSADPRPTAGAPVARGEGGGATPARDVRVVGAATVYRLYDVGYGIDLKRALDLLASRAAERVRPVRGEAQAIQIKDPPVTVVLGAERLTIDGAQYDAEVSARIFDFGVVSLRVRIPAPGELAWPAFTAFGAAIDAASAVGELFAHHLRLLTERIRPAVERLQVAPVSEDYIVYRIGRLRGADGVPLPTSVLGDADVVPLLLNESRPLSADAQRELLPHRFSYYADDLAILTWENALVVDPEAADSDVEYVLEFANAQLLELRYYDAVLDEELPRMYDRVGSARSRGFARVSRRYARLLADLQRVVADTTELVERVDNSLKVTDDVYLARIYAAALEIFRGRAWRAGIDRKLGIIRETYAMLNGEAQAARAEALELTIVLLIVAEFVLALVSR